MDEVSIKVTIANRIYPLIVGKDEEGKINKAAEIINESLQGYKENYSVKDTQDLLAMYSLQCATQLISKEGADKANSDSSVVGDKLQYIERLVDQFLQEK